MRAQRGKLVATRLGEAMLSNSRQGGLPAMLFQLAFWHMIFGYFGRGLLGSWPQADIGIVHIHSTDDWQTSEKLTRLLYHSGAGHVDRDAGPVDLCHGGADP